MARLTEEMVIARSKQSDLSSIKKLNCWGAELGDVSLLRRMPNVEVLAFSINKIRSLQDFAGCRLLRELYVRKNEIKDLREIRHLRHLPALTSLWLDENPCTHHPQYRLTVLRNLPRLEKLDNVAVQQEELEEAQRRGSLIDSDDEGYPQQQEAYAESVRSGGSARRAARARSSDSSPERDYGRPEPACRDHRPEPACRDHRPEPACRDHRPEPACRDHRPEPEPYRDHQRHDQEYAYAMNGECRLGVTSPHEQYCERGDNRSEYTPSTVGRGDWERERDREFPRERDAHSAGFPSAVMGEHRGFTRRPVTRNSNLLSAVLCLVKELDYPSLEVAEMAVRCRMDELANSQ
ncbi:cilia- and flagella-associated protein 410 isoform X6 [Cydia pomonella]|uniref:cilia- and flagella-associated protein 410 isoform X6 n=1 Tax=Cydia pomonella TaxID=82600 RepID=UPI002ADE80DB|nr:cilia- and flagella-associated protein 410 isoform X6 [Cydia pomonella]